MSRVPDLSDLDLQLEDVEDYGSEYPTDEADIRNSTVTDGKSYRRGVITSVVLANKKIALIAGSAVLVLLIMIGVLLGGADEDDGHAQLVVVDPAKVDKSVTQLLYDTLVEVYDRHELDTFGLIPSAGDKTPQRRALYWLASEYDESLSHTARMTRYALAVFYYSTNNVPNERVDNPKTWYTADKWLTEGNACEWQGIECNDSDHVVSISMLDNNLSGKIPPEIDIVGDKLEQINLNSNMIYMTGSDYDAFTGPNIKNLKKLLMNDNYLSGSTGLPTQLSQLTNLEKLAMSYNLLHGELESDLNNPVLGSLTKLTHLEVESCFLSGSIPEAVGNMTNLEQLYLRRNSLESNLDFLKTGNLENIFTIWLDHNKIKGTIPHKIGRLSTLASLSITNATLTGTLPKELGDINGLARVWLYKNDLTGTIPTEIQKLTNLENFEIQENRITGNMPNGVCNIIEDAIKNADDDFERSLASDCKKEVSCSCCTECF
eukprot:scaffold1262_cov106-Cylindrotheca_fusiformis.AAC.6